MILVNRILQIVIPIVIQILKMIHNLLIHRIQIPGISEEKVKKQRKEKRINIENQSPNQNQKIKRKESKMKKPLKRRIKIAIIKANINQ